MFTSIGSTVADMAVCRAVYIDSYTFLGNTDSDFDTDMSAGMDTDRTASGIADIDYTGPVNTDGNYYRYKDTYTSYYCSNLR